MPSERCEHPSARRLLITGCGRSGTRYITFLLRRLGLDVRHECMGKDGVASWYMAVDADQAPLGPVRHEAAFEQVFHQVRHPLPVIASAATFKRETWDFICTHIPVRIEAPLHLRCAEYWYYWNLEAEKIAHWRYRIEDISMAANALCQRLNVDCSHIAATLEQVSIDVNTRRKGRFFHLYEELCERIRVQPSPSIKHWLSAAMPPNPMPTVSWEELQHADIDLTTKIKNKAVEYGYVL